MARKIALVTDFDGTISHDDFFYYITDRYFDEAALEPWRQYLRGEKSHFAALSEIFAKIRLPEAELLRFIDGISYDKSFWKTAKLCFDRKIPLTICSAGCDYYIHRILGQALNEYDIRLVTNHGVYGEDTGLVMVAPPSESLYYDKDVGISKAAVVQDYQRRGFEVVFAGDGPPDFAPAKLADVVFAKKFLLEKCREVGIPTHRFDSYDDVYDYLKEL